MVRKFLIKSASSTHSILLIIVIFIIATVCSTVFYICSCCYFFTIIFFCAFSSYIASSICLQVSSVPSGKDIGDTDQSPVVPSEQLDIPVAIAKSHGVQFSQLRGPLPRAAADRYRCCLLVLFLLFVLVLVLLFFFPIVGIFVRIYNCSRRTEAA